MSDELTRIENDSIRTFLHSVANEGYLRGRVLDYGSGRQPYRRIVEEHGGEYVPYDSPCFPCSSAAKDTTGGAWSQEFDTILCTQVVQYVEDVTAFLTGLRHRLYPAKELGDAVPIGHLVLTYPTNWPEVDAEDLHRFTRTGMNRLLADAGWTVLRHERRESIHELGYDWAFGYGVVARA